MLDTQMEEKINDLYYFFSNLEADNQETALLILRALQFAQEHLRKKYEIRK